MLDISVSDGICYYVEFKILNDFRQYNYCNPQAFLNSLPNKGEYKNFVGILMILNGVIGQTNDSILISKTMHHADYSQCGHNFIITSGINRTNYTSYEFSFGRSYSAEYNSSIPETFSLYSIGAEVLSDKAKLIIAPKLSCELDFYQIPVCISRLNILYYINPNGEGSLKYRHEIGLTYRGYINLNYSYTFGLTNKDYYRLGHGINLQLNVPLGKRKRDKVH